MLTLSECRLSFEAARSLLANIDTSHHDLTYLDFYGNDLGDQIVPEVSNLLDRYDLIEFIGIGKNNLTDHGLVKNMLDRVGKKEITAAELAKYNDRVKERNLLMEKNKKLRTLKKPEEFLFHIDSLIVNEETKGSLLIKPVNMVYYKENLKFVNLMENQYSQPILEIMKQCYLRSPNIAFSLEGNLVTFDNMKTVRNVYGHKIMI